MQYPLINGDTAAVFTNEINLSDGNNNQAKIYPNSAGLAIISSPNNTLSVNRVKLTGPIDESDSAASKLYVDSFVTTGIHWKKPVISFRDLDFDMPSSPTIGDRYIQLADSGFFVKDYVYEYNGSVFVQHVTIEGDCLYVLGGTKFPDKTIVYSIIDGTGEWVQTGSSFDQTLNKADSVQFAGLAVTGNTTSRSLTVTDNGTSVILNGQGTQGLVSTNSSKLKIGTSGNELELDSTDAVHSISMRGNLFLRNDSINDHRTRFRVHAPDGKQFDTHYGGGYYGVSVPEKSDALTIMENGRTSLYRLKMDDTAAIISGINSAVIASGVNHDNLLTEQAVVRYNDNSNKIIGFIDRLSSRIYVSDSKLFIEPASGYTSYSYYSEDPVDNIIKMYTKTEPLSVNLFQYNLVYFRGELLQNSLTFDADLIKRFALVSYVYGSGLPVIFADERHTTAMDALTHYNLHLTQGSRLISGGAIDLTLNSTSAIGISITQGKLLDEDLEHTVLGKAVGDNLRNVYYGGSTIDPLLTYGNAVGPFHRIDNILQFNTIVGGTWMFSPVSNNNYVLGHVLATNALINNDGSTLNTRYLGFLGQNQYSTISTARDGALNEIGQLYTVGLPLPEFQFIGTVIYQQTGTSIRLVAVDGNSSKYIDHRYRTINAMGITPTSHSALSDLSTRDDHPQYALIIGRDGENITQHGVAAKLFSVRASDGEIRTQINTDATETSLMNLGDLKITTGASNKVIIDKLKLSGTNPVITSINTTLGTLDTSIPTCKAVRNGIANPASVAISSANDTALTVAGGVNMGTRDLSKTAWSLINLETIGTLSKIVYGRGQFVIMPSDETYVSLTPGRGPAPRQTYQNAITAGIRTSLIYENGIFLASRSGGIDYSFSGSEWFSCSGLDANNWQSIAYHNGIFSAVSSNGTYRAAYSTDGIRWTMNDSLANTIAHRVIHYSPLINKFIAVGDNRYICQSIDGISWQAGAQLLPVDEVFSQVLSTDMFIVFVGNSNCYYTLDLVTISLSPLSAFIVNPIRHISWNEGVYIASNQNGHFYSMDPFDFIPMTAGNVLMTAYANGDWLSIDLGGSIRRWTPYNVHNTIGINQSEFIRGDVISTTSTADQLIAAEATITTLKGISSNLISTSQASAFHAKWMKILTGTATNLTAESPQKIYINTVSHTLYMPIHSVSMEGYTYEISCGPNVTSCAIHVRKTGNDKALSVGSENVVLYANQKIKVTLMDSAGDSGYGIWQVSVKPTWIHQPQILNMSKSFGFNVTSGSYANVDNDVHLTLPPGRWNLRLLTGIFANNASGGQVALAIRTGTSPSWTFSVIDETQVNIWMGITINSGSGQTQGITYQAVLECNVNISQTTTYALVARRTGGSVLQVENTLPSRLNFNAYRLR